MRDVSSQILVIFENQAKEKNIELRVIFEGTSDAANNESMEPLDRATGWTPYGKVSQMALWGDQHRILQVVINLVSNSLKFTPHGGHVAATIRCLGEVEDILPSSRKQSLQSRTSKASKASKQAMRLRKGRAVVSSNGSAFVPQAAAISKEGAGDRFSPSYTSLAYDNNTTPPQGVNLMFEFEVQDSGPGIPESQQQRIFEPFVQGDLGLSKKYGGTGLGLSICSQLASLLGGTIHVTSKLEVGSTFVMQIPLRHVLHATESTAGSSVANLDSRRNSVVGEGPQAHNAAMDDAASSKSDRSHHDASKPAENENFETSNNPRLVGLSQPFFTSAPPMAPKKKAIKQAEAQATSRGDKVKVLVAEDNKVNQEVVLRMLKLEDVYDVTVAKGAAFL